MEPEKNLEPPQHSAGDTAHAVVRALLSPIPGAVELFSRVVTPPLERRRDEWMDSVATGLMKLEEKVEEFTVNELTQNEAFISNVMQASQIAMRTHQKEKLAALQNAVLNSALPDPPDEDIQQVFLHLIDSFTPWHLRVLIFFDNPRPWDKNFVQNYARLQVATFERLLHVVFRQLAERPDLCRVIVRDLTTATLVEIESIDQMRSAHELYRSRTTAMGKLFLKFISSPLS